MDLDVCNSDGRSEINEDNEGGEFGVIEKVSIKNLMCHANLKFSFGPNVNYILGRNGSGKSAVLAAIMIALGEKVVSTGRGLNVKNIIQKGKQAAKVAVTLRNTGPGAFCPELYGDCLTIERRLTIDGTSTYKIKNSSGQTVSSKKEDLNSILQEFNIQVLNPVAILTQDISRNFLNSKDSGDKYTFFYKATQLKQLEEEYDKINQKRGMAQCALQMKQDALPELNQEILALGKKLKDRESIAQQRTKLRELENEHAWALVIEKEMIAKDCYTAVEALRRKHEESKERLEMKKQMYSELVRKANSVEEEKTSLQNDMQCLERQRTESFNQKKELKNEIREIKSRIEQRKNGVKHLENEAQHMFSSIESSRARSEKDLKRKEEERIQEISMHRNRKKELIKNSHDLKSRINELEDVFENNKTEIGSKSESIRSLKYKIQATEKDLEKMKQYKCDRISAYGSDMPRLMQKIEELSKQHVFHKKPMGPVGLFVKVKDPKWTLAIERCLGRHLQSFLCDNMDDVDKLQEVIQKLNIQKPPSVIYSKFIYQVHDVSKNEVKSQKFCSVLQMLDESNPVVLNHLIDCKYIENIILVENNAEARQVMMHEKEVPMNCRGAYTLSGNNVCPAPNFAFYANKFKNSTLLSANAYSNNEMRLKENELEKLKMTKKQVEEEKDKLNREMMIQFKSRTRNLEECANLEKKISEEDASIKELENCEESNYIALLKDEFQKLQENLEAKRNKIIEDEKSLRILNAKIIDVENNIKEVKEKYDAKFSEINKLTNESLRSNLHTLRILQHEKVQLESRCNKYLQDFNDLNEEYLKKQEDADEDSKRAEFLSTRIDTHRKPEVIQHLIKQRKDLLKRNDGFESIEEVQLLFNKKKADYKRAERHITEIDSFLKKLRHLMSQRLAAFKIIQSHVSLRVRYLFTTNLDCQKFAGKLIFDHEKRTLDIYAQPISCGHTTSKSTKSLSGGERSFTTVALMLALWDAVEIPFKILDEYDVFMDQVNRKHCMDLMLRTALEHGRDQFIFLSPLQPSELESSEKIKILYMPEPKRSSTQDESMREENLLF